MALFQKMERLNAEFALEPNYYEVGRSLVFRMISILDLTKEQNLDAVSSLSCDSNRLSYLLLALVKNVLTGNTISCEIVLIENFP